MTDNVADPAANQLNKKNEEKRDYYTTDSAGIPLVKKDVSITVGSHGPMVIYDSSFFDQLAHFDRERIPERVVHAKGAGAFGTFTVTDDITEYTMSKVFEKIGKKTNILMRFSQVASNLGTADTVRDPRGFAIKFYTEEGIWDLVGNNTPIFFIRDPKLFPMFIHSQKRNPVTNIQHDWDAYWDFLSLEPQTIHQVLFLYSDRGIPDGHRFMHGYGSHTFSFINKDRKLTWVKFHHLSNQGIKNIPQKLATKIAGEDPDYALRDLHNAIKNKNYPSWTTYIQTMTPEEAKKCKFDPFDITKIWPHEQYPLKRVGTLTLNQNPENYFADIKQAAFNPNNMTPGIGASPDRLLQGRLFAYMDAHRYRLGVNFQQLKVNCPIRAPHNFQRDGFETLYNQGGAPNYHPNSYGGPEVNPKAEYWTPPPPTINAKMGFYDSSDEDNYSQPRVFYEMLKEKQAELIENLAGTLKLASETIRNRAIDNFAKVHEDLGRRLRAKVAEELSAAINQ